MKKFKNILTLCMALAMLLSCIPAVHAAEVPDATINYDNSCSLTMPSCAEQVNLRSL